MLPGQAHDDPRQAAPGRPVRRNPSQVPGSLRHALLIITPIATRRV